MKSSTDFRFKQFSITQDKSTHKVGTDGVLLGAWANVANTGGILEIGTGSGVIAIMLAQRTPDNVIIDAVEIEKDDAIQAELNVQRSPWPEKINIHAIAVQQFFPERKYDLIVTNPPFFINSWLPPQEKRSRARHTQVLSFAELVQVVIRLLKEDGRLAIILPYKEGLKFTEEAGREGLYCIRTCAFRSRSHKPVERLLLEFSFRNADLISEDLILYSEGEQWSEDYRRLTRDFYLKS